MLSTLKGLSKKEENRLFALMSPVIAALNLCALASYNQPLCLISKQDLIEVISSTQAYLDRTLSSPTPFFISDLRHRHILIVSPEKDRLASTLLSDHGDNSYHH